MVQKLSMSIVPISGVSFPFKGSDRRTMKRWCGYWASKFAPARLLYKLRTGGSGPFGLCDKVPQAHTTGTQFTVIERYHNTERWWFVPG